MSLINYSIIIPHKNSPSLLQRCINSIPRRNDIQIIIVDDNSDSDKVNFDCFPGINEKYIEVYFTKEGKGAGYARNIGLRHAKGKWLLFADADDYYVKNFIFILDQYLTSQHDIIYFKVTSDTKGKFNRSFEINKNRELYIQKKISINNIKYLDWAPWNKMFLREFIEKYQIKFDEIPIGNDAFFSFYSGEKSVNPLVINDEVYCITHNTNSITFSNRTYQKDFYRLTIDLRINNFLRGHNLKQYQIPIISYTSTFGFIKKYGFKKTIQYLSYIYENDSILRYILLYLYKKLTLFITSKP